MNSMIVVHDDRITLYIHYIIWLEKSVSTQLEGGDFPSKN